jgi:flagellar motor switch protein FliN/FliY
MQSRLYEITYMSEERENSVNETVKSDNKLVLDDVSRMEDAVRKLDLIQGGGAKSIFDIPVLVQVVVGAVRLPLSEIMKLKAGSVILLDREMGEPVSISVGGKAIALAQIVVCDGDRPKLGVSIIDTKEISRAASEP